MPFTGQIHTNKTISMQKMKSFYAEIKFYVAKMKTNSSIIKFDLAFKQIVLSDMFFINYR